MSCSWKIAISRQPCAESHSITHNPMDIFFCLHYKPLQI